MQKLGISDISFSSVPIEEQIKLFKDYGFEDASLFRYTNKDGIEKDLTFPDFFDENGDKVDNERLADFVNKVMNWKRMES